MCDLSRKFGCAPEAAAELLALAAELRIKIAGLSFHVGSQAMDSGMYVHAIDVCRELMGSPRPRRMTYRFWISAADFRWIMSIAVIHRGLLRADSPRLECTRSGRARDRRAGPLYRGPSAISVSSVMGARCARWSMVVLPRRRLVRQL
jgi:hypothetical protein